MNWLEHSLASTIASSVVLSLALFYLYKQNNEKYLFIWSLSWVVSTLRYFFLLISSNFENTTLIFAAGQTASLLSGFLFLIGAYGFLDKKLPFWLKLCLILDLGWILSGIFLNLSLITATAPTVIFVCLIYAFTGIVFLRYKPIPGIGKIILGWSLIAWAINKAFFPYFVNSNTMRPWDSILVNVLFMLAAVGIMMMYFQKSRLELHQSSLEYKKLFGSIADPILIFNQENHKFIDCNEAVINIYGYTKDEILLMTPEDLHPKEDLKKVENSIDDKENISPLIYTHITKSGKKLFVEIHTQEIEYNNQKAWLSIVRDITERRLLEEQLQIRQKMDSLGILAGGIAHDFNNILVGIIGNIDLLMADMNNFTPKQKQYLKDCELSSERARDLIQQFYSFSKVSLTDKTSVDVYEIVKEVFSLLEKTTDKMITKKLYIVPGEFYINANPTELNQVLLNLGTNAVQAIEARGVQQGDCIRVNAEKYTAPQENKISLVEGEYIHITFNDNGIGMSEEVIRKAFDPLFTTKVKGGKRGQGLGLAMVYNIVTRVYKGHIYIESKENKGTIFHIYLPAGQKSNEPKKQEDSSVKTGLETILLVDDEQMVLKIASELLNQYGYTILSANEGKQALEIFRMNKDHIDAVILDLTMPQMSGEMVMRELLEICPDVKVIISSGHSEEYTREGILEKAKGNISKPYKLKDLAQTVRTVLDS